MIAYKCKMCGGNLNFEEGSSVYTCEYCGTKQTLPRLDDDRKANLYDRANHFRRSNEYDKAMAIYEQILIEDITDSETYWSLVLCRYGIEYVEDPATRKMVPTINRTQFDPVLADEDYKKALEYADDEQKIIYEKEAAEIDSILKGILDVSRKEEPFDVFICYKETDNNGRRTMDSVLANDLYHQLTQEGFKVFFSRITLEDKLGTAYEPYIFAALNSAKVMVVLGTRPEYFSAVWVKNEWSRYLALIKKGEKKVLVPAYKDMDPYDLPEEFSHLQAQDMSKLGFMQDLIRGIKKLTDAEEERPIVQPAVNSYASNISTQIKRGNIAIEDEDWDKAGVFFEQALNLDAECAQAYLGLFFIEIKCPNFSQLIIRNADKIRSTEKVRKNCIEKYKSECDSRIKKYTIPDYLPADTIRREYVFDPVIESYVECERKNKEDILSLVSSNRNLIRARNYAKGDFKNELESQIDSLKESLDSRIRQQESDEQNLIQQKRRDYESFLQNYDGKIQKMFEQAANQKEMDYCACIDLCQKAVSEDENNYALSRIKKFAGYKEADSYIVRTRQIIDKLAEERRLKVIEDEKRALQEEAENKKRQEKAKKRKESREKVIAFFANLISILSHAALIYIVLFVPLFRWYYMGSITQYLLAQCVVVIYCLVNGLCARAKHVYFFPLTLPPFIVIGKSIVVLWWAYQSGMFLKIALMGIAGWIVYFIVYNMAFAFSRKKKGKEKVEENNG